jgi:cytochrome oxidase Cu insertion factor (SCO1/SenC/PrrC family)
MIRTLLMASLLLLASATLATAETRAPESPSAPAASAGKPPAGSEEKARAYFTDLPVVTPDGKTLRFYSDVLKDRVVVVSMFYATCPSICPVNMQKLVDMREVLGKALGRDVFFVSITVDPENDTPGVLRKFAEKWKTGEGWYVLTGRKEDIATITRRLGQAGDSPEDHVTLFLLGNVARAHWAKATPDLPAEVIVTRLQALMDAPAAAGAKAQN